MNLIEKVEENCKQNNLDFNTIKDELQDLETINEFIVNGEIVLKTDGVEENDDESSVKVADRSNYVVVLENGKEEEFITLLYSTVKEAHNKLLSEINEEEDRNEEFAKKCRAFRRVSDIMEELLDAEKLTESVKGSGPLADIFKLEDDDADFLLNSEYTKDVLETYNHYLEVLQSFDDEHYNESPMPYQMMKMMAIEDVAEIVAHMRAKMMSYGISGYMDTVIKTLTNSYNEYLKESGKDSASFDLFVVKGDKTYLKINKIEEGVNANDATSIFISNIMSLWCVISSFESYLDDYFNNSETNATDVIRHAFISTANNGSSELAKGSNMDVSVRSSFIKALSTAADHLNNVDVSSISMIEFTSKSNFNKEEDSAEAIRNRINSKIDTEDARDLLDIFDDLRTLYSKKVVSLRHMIHDHMVHVTYEIFENEGNNVYYPKEVEVYDMTNVDKLDYDSGFFYREQRPESVHDFMRIIQDELNTRDDIDFKQVNYLEDQKDQYITLMENL